MDKIKVAIYCRISPFADEFTLTYLCGVQKAALLEKTAESNFEVAGCYEDIGYTGSDIHRPGLLQMLRDYEAGKFSLVLAVNRDRIYKGDFRDAPNLPFRVLSVRPNPLQTSGTDFDIRK